MGSLMWQRLAMTMNTKAVGDEKKVVTTPKKLVVAPNTKKNAKYDTMKPSSGDDADDENDRKVVVVVEPVVPTPLVSAAVTPASSSSSSSSTATLSLSAKVISSAQPAAARPPLLCPITYEPLEYPNKATILSDGFAYNTDFIAEWIEKNPTATVSPMAIPLPSKSYASIDLERRCSLTREEFKTPVILLPLKDVWTSLDTSTQSYESTEFLRGLESTWVKYENTNNFLHYEEDDTSSRNLGGTHVLIPNRLLWNTKESGPIVLPKLPTRGPAPEFDERKLTKKYSYVVDAPIFGTDSVGHNGDLIDSSYNQLSKHVPPDTKNGGDDDDGDDLSTRSRTWTGIRAKNWTLGFHSKEYTFRNCQFDDCVFKGICWCSITFVACKFVNCTWIQCDPKGGVSRHMFNNVFVDCIIAHKAEDAHATQLKDMKTKLIGVQSSMSAKKLAEDGIFVATKRSHRRVDSDDDDDDIIVCNSDGEDNEDEEDD